ncbi:hypothetical protein tb265_08530 [Gemmatimonadetes bacterium T265]|nr:hypothetical protein tb265_08530 [Gemmatimonadetes bacterium T265]
MFGPRWGGLLAAAVLLVWAAGAALPLSDYDLGMHLRVGEWIVTRAALPRTEPFAWTRAGAPYLAYSWLAEASYYLVWREWGPWALQALNGVVLVAGALAVGLFARLARHSAWTTALLVAAHVVVMALCAPTLRPQGLLAVALPLCWAATARLARDLDDGAHGTGSGARWPYLLLVGATALAANTHLFAPGCAAALALVVPRGGDRRGWRVLLHAATAVGIGLLCTPYAAEWSAVYRLYLAPTPLLRFPSPITELTPGVVYLTRGFGAAWVIAPALALLPWLVRPTGDARPAERDVLVPAPVPGALLWLGGLLFFGLAIRGLFVWWLVCLPLTAAALGRVPTPTVGGVGRLLRAAPLALFAVMAAGNAREGAEARAEAWSASPRRLPNPVAGGALRLADSLDRVAPGGSGRMVTTFNYGNALLWRLPRYSMSLDGRAVFPDSATALDGWVRASRRADTLRAPLADADLVLLPDGHTGLAQVARAPGWARVARLRPARGVAGDTAELWARAAWLRRYGARVPARAVVASAR